MANEKMIPNSGDFNDKYEVKWGSGDFLGYLGIGYIDTDEYSCAIRFPSVNVNSVQYAGLYWYTQFREDDFAGYDGDRQGDWTFEIAGINEDNTPDFDVNSPFGRDRTNARDTSTNSNPPAKGTWKEVNVTNSVKAVVNRGGWHSGNAIALRIDPVNSNKNKYSGTGDDTDEFKAFLVIRESSEPNFNPSSKSVPSPTFPAAQDRGLIQAYPGISVFEATEDQIYYTSRKRVNKVLAEGVVSTTANTVKLIAHGLSYTPRVEAFAKSTVSNKRFRLPRYMPTSVQQGPEGDTLQGDIEVNDTYLRIITTQNAEVYYRIFIDLFV